MNEIELQEITDKIKLLGLTVRDLCVYLEMEHDKTIRSEDEEEGIRKMAEKLIKYEDSYIKP